MLELKVRFGLAYAMRSNDPQLTSPLQNDRPSSRASLAFEFGFGFQYDEGAAGYILVGPC